VPIIIFCTLSTSNTTNRESEKESMTFFSHNLRTASECRVCKSTFRRLILSCTTSSFLDPIKVTVLWVKKKGMRRALQNKKCLLITHIRERKLLLSLRCMQNFHVRIKSKIERLIENNRSILHVVPVPFIRKEEKICKLSCCSTPFVPI